MKEFDLSDKELKSLLQEEGLEEPSMGFNKSVLSKIEAYEKAKIEPIRVPKWLILSLLALFITPVIYILSTSKFTLNNLLQDVEMPSFNINLDFNPTYAWFGFLAILLIGMVVLFDKFLFKVSGNQR